MVVKATIMAHVFKDLTIRFASLLIEFTHPLVVFFHMHRTPLHQNSVPSISFSFLQTALSITPNIWVVSLRSSVALSYELS